MFKIELGAKVQDCVCGFSGVVTSRTEYLTGSNRYGVEREAKDGKLEEAWFDEARLVTPSVASLVLERSGRKRENLL